LWRGNVAVKNVVLLTCWSKGCQVAETQLSGAGWTAPFDEMERGEGFDMFCPFGQNRMVLMDGLTEGEHNEDDEEMDIEPPATGATASEQPHPFHKDANIEYEPDLRDMAAEEWIWQDAEGHNSKHMWLLMKTQVEPLHNTSLLCSESSPTMIQTPQIDSNTSRTSCASMKQEGCLAWVQHLIHTSLKSISRICSNSCSLKESDMACYHANC
jgi:hypothetical protein